MTLNVELAVGRFLAARHLVPARRHCLIDSLAFLDWLGPAAESLALVFGVKLDPFAAHCWIQRGECVINDRLDNIAPFTPVRVVPWSTVSL